MWIWMCCAQKTWRKWNEEWCRWLTGPLLAARPGLAGAPPCDFSWCFHLIVPNVSKAAVSLGSQPLFRTLLAPCCLRPTEIFLFSLKVNLFWVIATSGYYWIFSYWFENYFVTIFTSAKLESFTEFPCSIINVSFHRGSKLFTAITGFTMNCVSDTDFCVSKKWNKNWS